VFAKKQEDGFLAEDREERERERENNAHERKFNTWDSVCQISKVFKPVSHSFDPLLVYQASGRRGGLLPHLLAPSSVLPCS